MFGKPYSKPPPSEKTWEQGLRGGGSAANLRPLSSAEYLAVPLQKKVGEGDRTISTNAPRVYTEWKERLEDTGARMSSFMRRSRKEEGAPNICRDVLRANQGGLMSAVASANRYYTHGRARPGTAQPGSRQEWGRAEWPEPGISSPEFEGAPQLSGLFIGRGAGAAAAIGQGLFAPAGDPSREMPVTGRFWASSASSVASLHGGFPIHLRPTSGGASKPNRQCAAHNIPQSVLMSLHRRQQQQLQRKQQNLPVAPEQSLGTANQVSVMSGNAAWHPPDVWQPRLVEHQHAHNRPTVGKYASTGSPPRRGFLGNDSPPILPPSFGSGEIGGGMKEVDATASSLLSHSSQIPSKLRLKSSKTKLSPGASRALSLDALLPPRMLTRGI